MAIYDAYPWSELVPGAYVYDAKGEPWKLLEEHPQQRGTFLSINIQGEKAIVSDPGKPVRASVPDFEQAARHLHDILGARALEGQMRCEALPTTATKGAAARIRSHLQIMHGEYSEPSMRTEMLLAQHRDAHARGHFTIPHTHEGAHPHG